MGVTIYPLGEDATTSIEIRDEKGEKKWVLVIVEENEIAEFDLTLLLMKNRSKDELS